jgi:hypothetical protein
MSICIAIAVPDGIALAADSQTTWNETIITVKEKDTNRDIYLAQPINIPVGWSKMAIKLFKFIINGKNYAVCIAGSALLNNRTIFSIFKNLEKGYVGDGNYDSVLRHCIDGLKNELRKQLNVEDLAIVQTVLNVDFILCGYVDNDISKPRIESWRIFSGTLPIEGGNSINTGEYNMFTTVSNGIHSFGGCWIGRAEFISHLVLHKNPQLPTISGQWELLSLSDAIDYTNFLVEFTCDFQRFAKMVPDCGKPIISATLTVDNYLEQII